MTEIQPTADVPAEDVFLSLNGFDEIAIGQKFGADISQLRARPMAFLRALVFIDQRRRGANDHEAHQSAMEMPVSGVTGYFPEPAPEIDPEQPEGDEGKDDSPSA